MTTIAFYKPYDVLSQFKDSAAVKRTTLADFVELDGVYPAGRLDRDSEGLMILSACSKVCHNLTRQNTEIAKLYLVQVEGVPCDDAIEQLCSGVLVQSKLTKPARAKRIAAPEVGPRSVPIRVRKSVADSWIALELREGRNRQVRRMCAAVGHPCLRLIRSAIGNITLDGLEEGQWRYLSDNEVASLTTRNRT